MLYALAEAIASCLDRPSARQVNALQPDTALLRRVVELECKDLPAGLTDEGFEYVEARVLLEFLAVLQQKARTVLRRPAKRQPHAGSRL